MVSHSILNTGKKVTVLRDELDIKGGGLYAFMPFYNLDDDSNAIFKIGMAIDFNQRVESYHTYFPYGVWMIDFLENIPIPRKTRNNMDAKDTKGKRYLQIESYLFKQLELEGAKRIYTTARVRNPNVEHKGQTEYVYTNVKTIHKVFSMAHKEFGGTLHPFNLNEKMMDTYKKKQLKNPNHYIGELIFDW